MATDDDDPARASVRVAESVVALGRAEARLLLSETRALGQRVGVTLALSVLTLLCLHVAVLVLVLAPMLVALRPLPGAATVVLAWTVVGVLALIVSRRWRALGRHTPAKPRAESADGRLARGKDAEERA